MRLRLALLASLMPTLLWNPGAWAAGTTETAIRTQFKQIQAAMDKDDSAAALRLAKACLETVRQSGMDDLMPQALLMRGEALLGSAEDEEPRPYLLNAMGLASAYHNPKVLANALNDMGIICERDERPYAAQEYYREANAIANTLKDPQLQDAVTYDLATLECERGDFDEGYQQLQAIFTRAQARNDQLSAVKTLVQIADTELEMNLPEKAEASAQKALKLSKQLASPLSEQGALRVLAALAVARGDMDTAESDLRGAQTAAKASKDPFAQANADFDLGEFYAAHQRTAEALPQLEASETKFRQMDKAAVANQIQDAIVRLKSGKLSK